MIVAIAESHVPLTVQGLGSLLAARLKMEKIRLYDSNLLHLLVKKSYKDVTAPADYVNALLMPPPKPLSKKEVIAELKKKLG